LFCLGPGSSKVARSPGFCNVPTIAFFLILKHKVKVIMNINIRRLGGIGGESSYTYYCLRGSRMLCPRSLPLVRSRHNIRPCFRRDITHGCEVLSNCIRNFSLSILRKWHPRVLMSAFLLESS
jgi:hypothetical protein